MSVDIIIVSFNTRELLRQCLESIVQTCSGVPDLTTFVVDNNSADGSVEMVQAEFPHVHVTALDKNYGFGAANNRVLATHRSDHVLFLNSDTRLTEGALRALLDFAESTADCVAVGPKLVYPDGRFQASCRRFPTVLGNLLHMSGFNSRFPRLAKNAQTWMTEEEHRPGESVDMVSGACFLMQRAYLDKLGGFDENLFLYEEEADLFMPAAKHGGKVYYCADATVEHHHGASVANNDLSEFSEYHLYRSKYYRYRKHHPPTSDRLAYWSDRLVFALSLATNTMRGDATRVKKDIALSKRAYRDSFEPPQETR